MALDLKESSLDMKSLADLGRHLLKGSDKGDDTREQALQNPMVRSQLHVRLAAVDFHFHFL